jgi:hypothetical protein
MIDDGTECRLPADGNSRDETNAGDPATHPVLLKVKSPRRSVMVELFT